MTEKSFRWTYHKQRHKNDYYLVDCQLGKIMAKVITEPLAGYEHDEFSTIYVWDNDINSFKNIGTYINQNTYLFTDCGLKKDHNLYQREISVDSVPEMVIWEYFNIREGEVKYCL